MSVLNLRSQIIDIFHQVIPNPEYNEFYQNFMLETLEPTLNNNMKKFMFLINYDNTMFKLKQLCLDSNNKNCVIRLNNLSGQKNVNTTVTSIKLKKTREKKLSYIKIINSCIDNVQGINTKTIPDPQFNIIYNHFKNKECTKKK